MASVVAFVTSFIASNYSDNEVLEIKDRTITLVNNGSGLYKDESASGRYVYRGSAPNNYILFTGNLWRILAFEPDGTIKIIKEVSIGNTAFDENNSNEWIISTLNKYLNGKYYTAIKGKAFIQINDWSLEEKSWRGNVGLMNIQDYLKSNSSNLCSDIDSYFQNSRLCYKTNYINFMVSKVSNQCAWTMTKDSVTNNSVYYVGNTYFPDNEASFDGCGVFPVVYLKDTLSLAGSGTKSNPFIIQG